MEDHPSIRAIRANHPSIESEFEFKPVEEAKISTMHSFYRDFFFGFENEKFQMKFLAHLSRRLTR